MYILSTNLKLIRQICTFGVMNIFICENFLAWCNLLSKLFLETKNFRDGEESFFEQST